MTMEKIIEADKSRSDCMSTFPSSPLFLALDQSRHGKHRGRTTSQQRRGKEGATLVTVDHNFALISVKLHVTSFFEDQCGAPI